MTGNVIFAGETTQFDEEELAVSFTFARQLTALGFDEILIFTTLTQAEETIEPHPIDAALFGIMLL